MEEETLSTEQLVDRVRESLEETDMMAIDALKELERRAAQSAI